MWGYLVDQTVGALLVDGLAMYGVDLCRLDEEGGIVLDSCTVYRLVLLTN